MKIEFEGAAGIDQDKVVQLLNRKFGTKNVGDLYQKMIKTKVVESTGQYTILQHPQFKTPTKKVMQMLAQNGILVRPKIRLDIQRLADLIGADNIPKIVKQ